MSLVPRSAASALSLQLIEVGGLLEKGVSCLLSKETGIPSIFTVDSGCSIEALTYLCTHCERGKTSFRATSFSS